MHMSICYYSYHTTPQTSGGPRRFRTARPRQLAGRNKMGYQYMCYCFSIQFIICLIRIIVLLFQYNMYTLNYNIMFQCFNLCFCILCVRPPSV